MNYSINGTNVIIGAGDAIVFMPGDFRERVSGGAAEYISYNVEMGKNELLPGCNGVVRGCVGEEIIKLTEILEMVINSDSPYETVKSELLFKALFYSVFDTDNDKTKPILHVQNIKKYIREHINERITLDQIAKAVFLSPNYCNRIFKKRTGSTISDFIINEKIIEAKKMILQGEVLSEVARRLGYQEYSYFSRQFKKITGITPIYFRAAKSLNP